MEKRKWRLRNIPPFTSPWRKLMLSFTKYEQYKQEIEGGRPFFTEEELSAIEERFRDTGMTRKDIMDVVRKRGWSVKESTLKNYIQKSQVPHALRRIRTNRGMISIYPNDMIRHFNFVQYCVFVGRGTDVLIQTLNEIISENDEAYLEMFAGDIKRYAKDPVFGGYGLMSALWQLDDSHYWQALEWAALATEQAFRDYPAKREKYLRKINEIRDIQAILFRKTGEFRTALRADSTPVPPDMVDRLLAFEE